MNILLTAINAKYIHSNLAVFSLKKYAEQHGAHINMCEYTINQYTEDIMQDIYKKKPDFLAFSCYIWNIEMVLEIASELKKILPELPIWVGGPEVSYEMDAFLKVHTYIDGIMYGEGEKTFLELTTLLMEGKENYSSIDGIAYRENAQIIINKPRQPMDLSELPFPYENMEGLEHKIVYYETSRGCPFSCSYCLSSIDKGVRLRNLELVKQELQFFLDRKVPQVKFIDRTFNCNHIHAMAIWQYIKEHDNGITNFHFEISADLLKDEELALLETMRVGLVQLEIGVQSTNQETIAAIHRTMNLDKLTYAVKRVEAGENIHQHLDLIAGLPYEDYETFRRSFNDVYAMAPDQLQLGFLKVLKGSQMYVEQKEHGLLYKSTPPYEVLQTKWLTYAEVLELKKVEDMVEVYYNSTQFAHSIAFLMHYFETPFDFYQELGDYYEKQGLHMLHHTRIARYDILLAFIQETKPEIVAPLKELLVYDLYLRENMKSRPSFGMELEGYKDAFHSFYKKEEQRLKAMEPSILSGYKEYQVRQIARMTHIEPFTFDLLKLEQTGEVVELESYLLFDYKKKHPLTQEATTYSVSIATGQ